ncbi:MAG: hypothetical protein AB7E48_03110 [Deferribacterales bacterium]
MPELRDIFGGASMKYWYVAFIISMAWLVASLVNNAAVSQYELTLYDNEGKVIETKIVDKYRLQTPESLPVTKSYKPIKPVSFL